MSTLERVLSLPIWQGKVSAEPLDGGITNVNYRVRDARRQAVVRVGNDIPVHHVMRFNELAASRAAHAAGVSPGVIHAEPGIMVIEWVEGRTLTAEDVQSGEMPDRVLDLLMRAHREMPRHLRGPAMIFWVFHVIRDYAATLSGGLHAPDLPEYLSVTETLEKAVGAIDLVFGHNDLLPANLIDDGKRLWLIDWDYAGFNSPLFDLGGLAANNALSSSQETRMLERYFGKAPDAALWHRYRAMKAAAALREAMWSMVSEAHSDLDVDFHAYTVKTLAAYRSALEEFHAS
jgi:thiamine kinase-like enzyme